MLGGMGSGAVVAMLGRDRRAVWYSGFAVYAAGIDQAPYRLSYTQVDLEPTVGHQQAAGRK